jgi:ribosomal protein L15E
MRENLKIGDEIYSICNSNSYRDNRSIARITSETKLYWKAIVNNNGRGILISKDNGLERGTGGEGRFASFSRVHWYKLTPEKKAMILKETRIRRVSSALAVLNNIEVNEDNYVDLESLVAPIYNKYISKK